MWNWIMKELYNACRMVGVSKSSGTEIDDVVQDVCMQLLNKKNLASDIYNNKKKALLVKLVKTQIYESKSKIYFNNKTAFFRYQRVMDICDKYGINPVPENAYKISAIIDNPRLSITLIETLIKSKKDIAVSYQDYMHTKEEYSYD